MSPQRTLLMCHIKVIRHIKWTWWMGIYVTACQWCMPCCAAAVFLLSSTWIISSELSRLITSLWCGGRFSGKSESIQPELHSCLTVPLYHAFHSPLTDAKPNRQDKLIRRAPRLAAFAPSASTAKTKSPSGESGAFWDHPRKFSQDGKTNAPVLLQRVWNA